MPNFGMDVGFQGESGSRSEIAKLSRLTQLRHSTFGELLPNRGWHSEAECFGGLEVDQAGHLVGACARRF
jgi:hypothetical protein